ncbi:MAG: hypothetical protein ACRD4O_15240 [Bryobacteraceae bacterium]
MIRFNHVIPPATRDYNFMERIKSEMEGILYWSIAGAARLYANRGRFTEIPEAAATQDEYVRSQNPVFDFIDEKCLRQEEGDNAEQYLIRATEFRDKLAEWSKAKPLDLRILNSLVEQAGIARCRPKGGPLRDSRCFAGIQWRS